MGMAGQVNYSSSKAGMIGFTKALAKEVGKANVTVNSIACGFIDTDMTATLPQEYKDKMVEMIPVRRFGKPEEVAKWPCSCYLIMPNTLPAMSSALMAVWRCRHCCFQ